MDKDFVASNNAVCVVVVILLVVVVIVARQPVECALAGLAWSGLVWGLLSV